MLKEIKIILKSCYFYPIQSTATIVTSVLMHRYYEEQKNNPAIRMSQRKRVDKAMLNKEKHLFKTVITMQFAFTITLSKFDHTDLFPFSFQDFPKGEVPKIDNVLYFGVIGIQYIQHN